MSNGNESPGIGGVSGLAKLTTKAPRAWKGLMQAVTVTAPRNLSTANKAIARLRRL